MIEEVMNAPAPTPTDELGPFDPTLSFIRAATALHDLALPADAPHRALLQVVDGVTREASYALDAGEHVIGRSGLSSIHLPQAGVSRTHARILQEGDAYVVEDLDSTNGTYVNGERIDGRRRLRGGDRIDVGRLVTFRLHCPAARDDAATPPTTMAALSNLTETQLLFWL
jgi:pSer/pThr/pTyr-binding forkhead associated (FHA) protein